MPLYFLLPAEAFFFCFANKGTFLFWCKILNRSQIIKRTTKPVHEIKKRITAVNET